MKRSRIITSSVVTLVALVCAAALWVAERGGGSASRALGPGWGTARSRGPEFVSADLNDLPVQPEKTAERAIKGGDWRVLSGPRDRIEGVECSIAWSFGVRDMVPVILSEVAREPGDRNRPWGLHERRQASQFARFNRRIIADPHSPLYPFCRPGGFTAQGHLSGGPIPVRPWQVLRPLPRQDEMLAAARANQPQQTRSLALPEHVDRDFLQMTILGWAAVHHDHDLLARIAQDQGTKAYCNTLIPYHDSDPNIPNPIQLAITNNDTRAAFLLMRLVSSPACTPGENDSDGQGTALSGALYQAEQRGPDMVLAVVDGFRSTRLTSTWGLAESLRKKGYVAAARVAARRWGPDPGLSSTVSACDFEGTRFWVESAAVPREDLLSSIDSILRRSTAASPSSPGSAHTSGVLTQDCVRTVAVLRGALH